MNTLPTILTPERFRQRISERSVGDRNGPLPTIPALSEIRLGPSEDPLLASNMRGTFVPTRTSSEGMGRYGFSEISPEEEGSFIAELHRCLLKLSTEKEWLNRCTTPLEGIYFMRRAGFTPKYVVLPKSAFSEGDGSTWKLEKLAQLEEYVKEKVEVLLSDLPVGAALVTAAPSQVGVYTRVGDYLGVLLRRVDRTIAVVAP